MSINNLNTYLNVRDAHLRVVSGNVYAQAMNIGGINVETAHGLQSVSDTGNVTSNTLQFSNATTGFVTTANVQIGRDLVVTGNATVSTDLTVSANATVTDTLTITEHLIASKEATVTGNLNVTTIRSDSNVVAEYTGPHDRPLRKYPEVALTSASDSGYVVTRSSENTASQHYAWELFDNNSATKWLATSGDSYSTTSPFLYNGTNNSTVIDVTNTPHNGAWVKLQLPVSIKLSHVIQRDNDNPSNRVPGVVTFLGSNNGSDWTFLKEFTGLSNAVVTETMYVNSTVAYSHYAYVVKNLSDADGQLDLGELEYYGHEEGSGSLDTTLKTMYNVPATTGTQLEVYYDAKNYTSGTITDESPNSYVGTLNGNTQLETVDGIKAFTFDGNGDTITGTVSGASGEYVHSIVFWVKFEDLVATGNQGYTLFEMGPRAQDEMIGLYAESDMINYYFYSNDNSYVLNGVSFGSLVNNQWYQIAATYSGGSDISNRKIYINGNEITRTTHGGASSGPLSLTNGNFTIGDISGGGGSNDFKGSIANFRLYSKALNADQVKELYDYQKDYFLGSKSQVTLYKGHLGVGVTEPSGQLELAGDERIQEYPPMAMTGWETYMEGHGVFRAGKSGHDDYLGTGWERWKVFNKGFTANGGPTGDAYHGEQSYSSSTGLYTGVGTQIESLGGISGDYFILDMPYKISLKHTNLTSANQNRSPTEFIILGSNDGSTWTQIKSFSSSFPNTGVTLPFQVNSTEYFSYFGLVVTKIVASDGYFMLSEWQLFGTPGPTTLDKGSLSLTRSLDVPRVSRYDVDTETPRPEKLVVDFDTTVNDSPTDISGNGNHGTFSDSSGLPTYSAADKAFKFVGVNGVIWSGTLSPAMTGDKICSMSAWFKTTNASTVNQTIMWLGAYSVAGLLTVAVSNGTLRISIGSGCSLDVAGVIESNTWYHVVGIKQGTGSITSSNFSSTYKLYLNGEPVTGTFGGTARTLNVTTNYWYVGAGNSTGAEAFSGYISNPKLYDTILEPSEVKKLYKLGRTGRSMVISDTAVGIGKAPEAQLDVRGDLRVGGRLLASVPYYAARQRDTQSYVFDESIVYDQYVYTNYPGSFVANSATDGYYQPPMNGMYQVHMECIVQGSGNIHIQRRTGTTVDISHDDRHYNYTQSGWMSMSADALIPITNHITQNIRIYVDGSSGNGAWAYNTYHGSAFFLWVSDIPERRQHHVA